MKNVSFTFDIPEKEILSTDEVHFFYYDVMRDTENNIQAIYSWNDKVEKFLAEKHIKIEVLEKDTLPLDSSKNELYFSVSKNESIPLAFFRHLRNAFAHHRIKHYNDYLCIEDVQGESYTMKGLIKYQDLKGLCFLFFDQRSAFENKHNF